MSGKYCAIILGLILIVVGSVHAGPKADPNTVIEIRIVGNKILSREAVLVHVNTAVGQPYSEKLLRADQKSLLKTGRFANVVASRAIGADGVVVTFQVVERPQIEDVVFEGAKHYTPAQLMGALTFGAGDAVEQHKIARGIVAIETMYKSDGFYFVKITLDPKALANERVVIYRIVEGPKVILKKILFKGNESFGARKLRGVISSRARKWPIESGKMDTDKLERDVLDLRSFYHSEGFLDAQVARQIDFTTDRKARVTFVIEEGPQYRIRNARFDGNRVYPDDELRRELRLAAGAAFNELEQRRDLEHLNRLYGEIGYVDVTIQIRRVFADEPGLLDLLYVIVEGEQHRIGRIDIRGNTTTKENVIRRQVQARPGQLYNTVAMDESRRRLQVDTGLFEKVTITPFGEQEGVRNALVEVIEGKTAQFLIGAGVSSNAGLLGTVSYTERNFDLFNWSGHGGKRFRGGGQRFSIVAEPGTEVMRFRTSWREPYLFDKPLSLGASLYVFTTGREAYDETRVGGTVSLGRWFRNRWYGEASTRIEGVNVDSLDTTAPRDVVAAKGTNLLAAVKGTLVRDRTDSRWQPSTGDRVTFAYEQVFGDFNFGKATADYRHYWTIYLDSQDRKHIIACRISGGGIAGDAPVYERFYGGGLGSVRGFNFRGISPRQGVDDDPVGGDFMVFAGAEYTFPLVAESLRGVFFFDTGTVESDFSISAYRAAVGFGLRWQIPFFGPMPINLNFAYPVAKDDNDDTQVFSFSLGWVF